jgi:pyruvate,orthophosphate dikinase
VAFTRNPSTGAKELYGEFLVNAQGEDVVAGIRTPQSITEAARIEAGSDRPSLEKLMPDAFAELIAICDRLENHYRDMQDWSSPSRPASCGCCRPAGKRTAKAALKIAVDMAGEGLITERKRSCASTRPRSTSFCTPPSIRMRPRHHRLGPAGVARAASGEIVFTSERPSRPRRRAARSSWCGSKPAPKTFTACTPPKAF